ncbi:MAG: glycosyltransferase family 2 protein [Lachnospiraceae bacterium]|nr:glycosyltransferase family 2 protein [Lachnospiraceae bacterium]
MQRKASFVIPAYNEEESLRELYTQVMDNVNLCMKEGLLSDYEFLFVDDGSTDNSARVMKQLRETDEKVRYIIFRKNFGKSIALQAAFRNVTGDIIITMDADLQDDPVELKNFLIKIDEGYDMVVGWKVNRLDSMEKKLPSKLFNKVTAKMSGINLHDFDCGYKAFRREVADSMDVYGEMHRYIPVLAYRNGFKITEIPVHHNKRKHGKSKYGMERYMRGLFDFISVAFLSNYHDRPMYFFGRVGGCSFGLGFLICLFLTIEWFMGYPIGTRPLLQLGVLLIFLGVQFLSIGFIGNMLVEVTVRNSYSEAHIKEKV